MFRQQTSLQQGQIVILHVNIWKSPPLTNRGTLCGRRLLPSATRIRPIRALQTVKTTAFIQTLLVKPLHVLIHISLAWEWRIQIRYTHAYRMVVAPVVLQRAHMPQDSRGHTRSREIAIPTGICHQETNSTSCVNGMEVWLGHRMAQRVTLPVALRTLPRMEQTQVLSALTPIGVPLSSPSRPRSPRISPAVG